MWAPGTPNSVATSYPIMGIEYEPSTDNSTTTVADCFGSNHGNIIRSYDTFRRFYKLSFVPDGA